jgi:hypothetical protein
LEKNPLLTKKLPNVQKEAIKQQKQKDEDAADDFIARIASLNAVPTTTTTTTTTNMK